MRHTKKQENVKHDGKRKVSIGADAEMIQIIGIADR